MQNFPESGEALNHVKTAFSSASDKALVVGNATFRKMVEGVPLSKDVAPETPVQEMINHLTKVKEVHDQARSIWPGCFLAGELKVEVTAYTNMILENKGA